MKTKVCNACNLELDISFFGKWKYSSDGYENRCKACKKKLRKKFSHTCLTCGKVFESNKKEQSYCSKKCFGPAKKMQMVGENNPNYAKVIHVCDGCGKEHLTLPCLLEKQKRVFCSFDCWKQHFGKFRIGVRVMDIMISCSVCGNVFFRKPFEAKRHKHLFCSRECYFKANGDLQRQKHSDKRIERNCEVCGKLVNYGRASKKKYKHLYCSRECKDKGISLHYSRENSPFWDSGKTNEERIDRRAILDYKQWRMAVYKRDKYTCQCCGDKKGGLAAHHIYSWNKFKGLRFDLKNGVTLCKLCHIDFHRSYGYGNNTLSQFNEWRESYGLQSYSPIEN